MRLLDDEDILQHPLNMLGTTENADGMLKYASGIEWLHPCSALPSNTPIDTPGSLPHGSSATTPAAKEASEG